MKTINTYILAGTLLLAGAFLAGCSKATDSLQPEAAQKPEAEEEILTPEVPQGPNEFILKVRSSIDTKALTDLGETLGSEWTQGDSVRVYNETTKQNIEGFLFAEADGTSTTFSGTVAGNFNQGDVLRLLYLGPYYKVQDGTLEGVASQCDYAVADVEILEIDPEAKTITTEVAEFVKQQAVVKFNLTNRKNPVEDLDVKSFRGYYELLGTASSITVKPAAATNELYVAIPYLKDMEITFEAEGADGYEYRLIVPDVSFEDGLYYRRTLNMKRKALVKAPVAKANLSYTSAPLALVDPAHVYWIVNEQEVILDNDKDYQQDSCVISYFVKKEVTEGTVPTAPTAAENGWMTSIPTQTHAGTYYVWTKMTGNYDYEDADVSDQAVKVEIKKTTPTISATAVSTDMTYNAQSQNLLSGAAALKIGNTVVTTAKDAAATACTIKYYVTTENLSQAPAANASGWGTSYSAVHAGTYYIWIRTEGNGDMNAATAKVSKQIKKATATVNDVSANPSFLVYDGSSQSLLSGAATLKIGNADVTSAKDASNTGCTIQYYVSTSDSTPTGGSWGSSYSATNAGTYYIWIKVTGNGDINDISQVMKASKQINKKTQTISLSTYSYSFWPKGDTQHPGAYYCDVTVNNCPDDSLISVTVTGAGSSNYSTTYKNNHVWRIQYNGHGGGYSATVTFKFEGSNYNTSTVTFTCS